MAELYNIGSGLVCLSSTTPEQLADESVRLCTRQRLEDLLFASHKLLATLAAAPADTCGWLANAEQPNWAAFIVRQPGAGEAAAGEGAE